MMKNLPYLILIIFFNSCAQKIKRDNPFIEEVNVTKSENHKRVKGTRFFAIIPDSYEYHPELKRYQKSENHYIQFMEVSTSFLESRNDMKLEESGIYDIISDTKFNGFSGVFAEGGDLKGNKEALITSFGDEDFSTIVYAQTEYDNVKGRLELIQILKSIIYEKSIELNELELANFTFEKKITQFKHSLTATNMFMFSENGKKDAQNEFANSMVFGNLPKMSRSELKSYTQNLIKKHISSGIGIISPQLKEITIGEYDALVLDSKTTYNGKNGLVYQVVLSNDEKSVMFIGTAYTNKTELRNKYIETIKSIKIK